MQRSPKRGGRPIAKIQPMHGVAKVYVPRFQSLKLKPHLLPRCSCPCDHPLARNCAVTARAVPQTLSRVRPACRRCPHSVSREVLAPRTDRAPRCWGVSRFPIVTQLASDRAARCPEQPDSQSCPPRSWRLPGMCRKTCAGLSSSQPRSGDLNFWEFLLAILMCLHHFKFDHKILLLWLPPLEK